MEVNKQNGSVCFNEENHLYWNENDNEKYVSVTTLIGQFGQDFDKDFWSAYKALEKLLSADEWKIEKKSLLSKKKFNSDILDAHSIDINDFNREQQNVLDEWDKKNREACERGTAIHAQLEKSMYDMGSNVTLQKFGIGGKFNCQRSYGELDAENGVYPEYLISRTSDDGILRIAGQIDLLVKQGNELIIADYKTNTKIEQKSAYDTATRSTVKMKYPLNNLDDTNYWHYALQLSTYAWMLQKINPDFIIKDLILIHFDHEDKMTVYHIDYLKKEVERMLAYHKKNVIKQRQKDAMKRIEY